MQGRSALPADAMLQQLHSAVADIEQLKADLILRSQHAQPAVPAAPATAGKKRLRSKAAANAGAQAQARLHPRSVHSRLRRSSTLEKEPVIKTDAATQSEAVGGNATCVQSDSAPSESGRPAQVEQSYGRSSISRLPRRGQRSEQPCLRAQRELVVPGQQRYNVVSLCASSLFCSSCVYCRNAALYVWLSCCTAST